MSLDKDDSSMRLFFDASNLLEEAIFQVYEKELLIGSILLEESKNLTFAALDINSNILTFRLQQNKRNVNYSYGAISPRRERKAFETNKPPAMRVRVEGYTKKGIPLLQ